MKIDFHYELEFRLISESGYADWVTRVIMLANAQLGNVNYIFCNDRYLLDINQRHLNHDTFTDIITFDYTESNTISGDIFISVDRIRENAQSFKVPFEMELKRVMIHGVLHLLGYTDKNVKEQSVMRKKEDEMMKLFHVEQ